MRGRLRQIGIGLGTAIGSLVVLASWIIVFPEPVLRIAPGLLAEHGIVLGIGDLSGNLVTGLVAENVLIDGPGFRAGVRRLVVRPDYTGLLARRIGAASIKMERPDVVLLPRGGVPPPPPKPASPPSAWTVSVGRFAVDDGRLLTAEKGGRLVTGIRARASLFGEQVIVRSARADVEGSTIAARATVGLRPLVVSATATVAGVARGGAVVQGSTEAWSARFRLAWRGARFTGEAGFRPDESWRADVRFERLNPVDLRLPVTAMGLMDGRLIASGRGRDPNRMDGRAQFDVVSSTGLRLVGRASLAAGRAQTDLALSAPGARAHLWGAAGLARRSVDLSFSLSTKHDPLLQWSGVLGVTASAEGRVAGRWPDLDWRAQGSLRDLAFRMVRLDLGTFRATGRGLPPRRANAQIALGGFRQGPASIDSAHLSVDGSTTTHTFALDIASGPYRLAGRGEGRLNADLWRSRWSALTVNVPEAWSAGPFALAAGRGHAEVQGLALRRSSSTLRLDGTLDGARIENARVDIDHLNLREVPLPQNVRTTIDGTLDATVTADGPLGAPSARLTMDARDVAFDGRKLGRLAGRAAFADRRLIVSSLTVTTDAGDAYVSASVPVHGGGPEMRPMSFRFRAHRLDPSLLAPPVSGVKWEGANIDADLAVTVADGRFSGQGRLDLTATKLDVAPAGLAMRDLAISLAAEGQELVVKRGFVRTDKKGTATLEGRLDTDRPRLSLHASRLDFATPYGVSGKVDADLALGGGWRAPKITGDVNVLSADVKPVKKKKPAKEPAPPPKKAPAAPPPASPLALDVRVHFDRDVWYKDGQSAVEAKGNVHVQKDAGAPVALQGAIETIRGDYFVFGRQFTIDHGIATFTGVPEINPVLDVRAEFKNESQYQVFIDISGTLDKPQIALSSSPPLDESDIISILVRGRPNSDPSDTSAGTTDAATARVVAGNFVAEQIRQRLQNKVNIDVLRFKVGEGGQTDLTIGQNITRRLFLSFGQTMGAEASRQVSADYTLSPHWGVEGTTTSLGRYVADLLFRYGFY